METNSTVIPNTTGMNMIVYLSAPSENGERMPGRCIVVPIVAWEMTTFEKYELPRADPILPGVTPEGVWGLLCPDGSVIDCDNDVFASVDDFCAAYSPVYHFEDGQHPAAPQKAGV